MTKGKNNFDAEPPTHNQTAQMQEIQAVVLLDVVVREGVVVLEPLAVEDQALLLRREAPLVLDEQLDVPYGKARVYHEEIHRTPQLQSLDGYRHGAATQPVRNSDVGAADNAQTRKRVLKLALEGHAVHGQSLRGWGWQGIRVCLHACTVRSSVFVQMQHACMHASNP